MAADTQWWLMNTQQTEKALDDIARMINSDSLAGIHIRHQFTESPRSEVVLTLKNSEKKLTLTLDNDTIRLRFRDKSKSTPFIPFDDIDNAYVTLLAQQKKGHHVPCIKLERALKKVTRRFSSD